MHNLLVWLMLVAFMHYGRLLITAVKGFFADNAMVLAAAISFYALLSLAPLLYILVTLAGYFWGQPAVQAAIVEQFAAVIGPSAAEQIEIILSSQQESQGLVAIIMSSILLLLGATGVFTQLKASLNAIWNVKSKYSGLKKLLRSRLLSLLLLAGLVFLMVILLLVSTAIDALSGWLSARLGIAQVIIMVFNALFTFMSFTLAFAICFKVLPDVRIVWRDVFLSSVITAVLLMIGKLFLSLYFATSSLGTSYGAAGALVIILVWVYYATSIFFFGAELAQAYMQLRGRPLRPSRNAVRL